MPHHNEIANVDAMLGTLSEMRSRTAQEYDAYLIRMSAAEVVDPEQDALHLVRAAECNTRRMYIEAISHLLDKVRDTYSRGIN